MLVLGLISCIVLRALSAQAKVVHSFEECKEFLYQGKEPSGMDQNAKKICQKLQNRGFSYASLYSVRHKIPLYSAYRFDPACSSDTERKDIWHLEPQISQPRSLIDYMVPDNSNNQNLYKENQAISSDYSGTGYDRGHLNPSSFQCSDGRTATFTLTNAAPMIPRFNQRHWKRRERMLRTSLLKQLVMDGGSATAFIVTGTVPDPNVRIPQDRKKVTVPSHIWTAVCYKHHIDDAKSFSFGYIGRNQQEEPGIRLMSVSDLNNELRSHFGTHQPIEIFADDCFGDKNKSKKVKEEIQELLKITLVKLADQISLGENDMDLILKGFLSSPSTMLTFPNMSTYYNVAEELKAILEISCLITYNEPQARKTDDELRKREVSESSDAVECQLVPEKQRTAADGTRCSCVRESDYRFQCNTGGVTKPCCSSPCLYQDKLNGYRCYSDQKLIECSPRYSLITVNGEKCLDDHPCATYGEDYYWCMTRRALFKDDWDYCSPPLRNSKTVNGKNCRSNHACAKYGKRYTWCYTDDKDSWDYC